LNIWQGDKEKMANKLTIALVAIMLIVGFAIGLVASPFILAENSSTTDAVWNHIQQTKVIKVGTDPTWPPYQLLDNNSKIVGFEVDLANAAAAKLGFTIDWQNVGFDNIILSVQNGQLDMGVSGFSITPTRLDQVSFTIPHSVSQSQVIMLQSTIDAKHLAHGVTSLEELKTLGITVGTQDGEIEQQELQAAGVAMHSWSDSASGVQDMISSNPSVQAVYAETPVTNAWITQYAAQGIQIGVVYNHPYYPVAFVVAKGSHTLLDKMDGALTELIADGTVDQLKAQWHAET
jgi:ABC-type amino acid transport substrate-binding protein